MTNTIEQILEETSQKIIRKLGKKQIMNSTPNNLSTGLLFAKKWQEGGKTFCNMFHLNWEYGPKNPNEETLQRKAFLKQVQETDWKGVSRFQFDENQLKKIGNYTLRKWNATKELSVEEIKEILYKKLKILTPKPHEAEGYHFYRDGTSAGDMFYIALKIGENSRKISPILHKTAERIYEEIISPYNKTSPTLPEEFKNEFEEEYFQLKFGYKKRYDCGTPWGFF